MLAVIIPAHNESELIGACVRSLGVAALHPLLRDEKTIVIVVADDCSDHTEAFAMAAGAVVLSVCKRNVGKARAQGADLAIAHGARWLAFTDADTQVAPDWLSSQLACQTDAVCGVIGITDWTGHPLNVKEEFYKTYRDEEGHRHIHGANLGCSAAAYRKAGGFQPLSFNEDVALVDALIATGASISWSNKARVSTSARLDSRTPWGFGATLRAASGRLACAVPSVIW
ncbi:glycosyl transferase [Caballeronia jiangsuensis]|nr:glycosyl transferase [Caballeronia jiangsuensis]